MMKKRHIIYLQAALAIAMLLLCPCSLRAQYFLSGDDPSSLKWREIGSANYSVIYPEGTDSLARRYLYLFESTRDITREGMRIELPKGLPIVLHPYTVGEKSCPIWSPGRIELYTTPCYASGYAVNHDLDVTLQVNRLLGYLAHYNTYIFKFLRYIGGEQTIALGVGFRPTVWQAIGDAAIHSNDITHAGAGNNGEFLMFYRASFLNGDVRSYDDWRYGSYRYYTPDKTEFGYLMFSNYRFFSDNYYALGDVMHIQMKDWWDIFGVWNRSFRTALHKTPRKNWRQMTAFNTQRWYADYVKRAPYTPYELIIGDVPRIYTARKNINPIGDCIYTTKSGMQHYSQLTRIDSTGKERNLRPFSSYTSRVTNDGKSKLLWSEVVSDPRWSQRSRSIIREYDLDKGRIRNLSRNTRLFNPVYSEDGESILSVEYPVEGSSRVIRLPKGGKDTSVIAAAPYRGQITEICELGNRIYALVITDDGMGLYSTEGDIDPNGKMIQSDSSIDKGAESTQRPGKNGQAPGVTGNDGREGKDESIVSNREAGEAGSESTQNAIDGWQCEIAPQKRYIQQMSATPEGLCFVCDLDGLCNIYLYDVTSHSLRRIVNSEYGSFYPTLKDGNLYYARFDHHGYHPVRTAEDDFQMKEASFETPHKDRVASFLEAQADRTLTPLTDEEAESLKSSIDSLPSTPYRKASHLLHIHSWAPFYANIDRISSFTYDHIYQLASLGATVISQNTLGTAVTQLGYSYHGGFHSGHLNFNYSGFYPVFELAVDFNDRHRQEVTITEASYNSDGIISRYPLSFNIDTLKSPSLDASLKVYVPLEFDRSGWKNGIVPEVTLVTSNDKYTYVGGKGKQSYFMTYDVTYGISAFRMLERSKRQLSPRLGIGVQLKGRNAIGPHNESGNTAYAYVYGYLPGITLDQNIKLSACYQRQYGSNTTFRYLDNFASMPRGYSSRILSNYAKFTFDYGIFIYAGDVTWPWLYYLSRLQVIPFADFGIDMSGTYPDKSYNNPVPQQYPYSFGADILLSGHFFRIGKEITFGLRYARTGEHTNSFKIIFQSNLK